VKRIIKDYSAGCGNKYLKVGEKGKVTFLASLEWTIVMSNIAVFVLPRRPIESI
jgi:hypothetical protein